MSNHRNNFKSLTNKVTFCHHTGIKIAVSTHFANYSKKLKLVAEHPIFNAKASQLEDLIVYQQLTTTEAYLACTAYLVNAGLVITDKKGLELDTEEFERSGMKWYLPRLFPLLRKHVDNPKIIKDIEDAHELPLYAVSTDNCTSGGQLKEYLKELVKLLEMYYDPSGSLSTYKADIETDLLRAELHKINNGYNDALPTKFIKKKFLRLASAQMSNNQLEVVKDMLFTTNPTKYKEEKYDKIAKYLMATITTFDSKDFEMIKQQIIRYFDHMVLYVQDIGSNISFDIVQDEIELPLEGSGKPTNKPTSKPIRLSSLLKKNVVVIDTTKGKNNDNTKV